MASVLSTATSVINAAGKISNILFDLSPKSFYSTRDFYNFIKKRQNAPMMRKHFTVVPKCQIITNTKGNIPHIWNNLFTDSNLARFAILVQKMTFPKFGVQPFSSNSDSPIKTPYGQYSPQQNGFSGGGGGNTIDISFLQTADPIIEHMVLPWYYECMRTKNYSKDDVSNTDSMINSGLQGISNGITAAANYVGFGNDAATQAAGWLRGKKIKSKSAPISQYPMPKLTLDIKFYRMDEISGLQFLMNPTFVYRLTGVYPVSISTVPVLHTVGGDGELQRAVTFKYNNFICIPNGQYEEKMYGNNRMGFAYKNMSPIQILNALNQTAQGAIGAVDAVRNIF